MPRQIVVAVSVLLAVLLVPVLLLWLFQRKIVFVPSRADPGPAAQHLPAARDVVLHTEDGLDLRAWYLPARPECGTTVLVAPGNAGDRAGRSQLAEKLHARGFGVLLMDYRGYGANPGSPTEDGLIADVTAARRFLDTESTGPVVYFGESLGGAAVSRLALMRPPQALVLRSPFIDLASAAAEHYPWLPVRLMLWDDLPVRDLVAQSTVPLTVIYGSADNIIPPELSKSVAAAAGGPVTTVEVPGAGHNSAALAHGPLVIDAVVAAAGDAGCR